MTVPTEVRADEQRVADVVVRSRRSGTGPTLVFLHHSFGQTGWMPVHDRLAAHFDVVVPDLPGFGASDRPVWAREVRDLAVLTGAWIRRSGLAPTSVVACGFGGWVAAELATMQPQVLDRLVLVGAAGLLPANGKILDQFLISHSEYVRAAFSDDAAYRAVFGDTIGDDLLVTWDLNREMTTRVAWKPYMYNRRLVPLLRDVEVPTLVVWGAGDRVVPVACGEQYASILPNARLEIVPGCGHAVDMEQPDVLADLVHRHCRGPADS